MSAATSSRLPAQSLEFSHDAANAGTTNPSKSVWANKYRGATVEDLDPPPALSCKPSDPISSALLSAFERDYTHLTVVAQDTRALLGYLNIPRLKELLEGGAVTEEDTVDKAMLKFRRKGRVYKVISMDTPLEELEMFFLGGVNGQEPQDFAVVTDGGRRFVLGVVTKSDLEEFTKRRPVFA
ncbi:MAG: atp3 gamma subunit of the F1 sector of mitochondrial F1F0 ATP synthase [Chaenotheca gracillima]|nr:MAG: atp3 gamma subunit of the F1 sector of mitochondrial F1F0 ATP synthase [Chaenotheca gracillima]